MNLADSIRTYLLKLNHQGVMLGLHPDNIRSAADPWADDEPLHRCRWCEMIIPKGRDYCDVACRNAYLESEVA